MSLFNQSRPFISFLLRVLIIIVFWTILTTNVFGFYYWLNQVMLDALQRSTIFILKLGSFELFEENRLFGIVNSGGVKLGEPCNGLSLMVVYMSFFLAIPIKAANKLLWILIGIIAIQFMNLIRILTLILLSRYYPELMHFNHDYTFTLLMYGAVFLTWHQYLQQAQLKNVS